MERRSTRRLTLLGRSGPSGPSGPVAPSRAGWKAPRPAAALWVLCSVLVLGLLTLPAAAHAAGSRCDDAPHHELDFWLGDWQVIGAGGEMVGTSRVESLHGGCLVREVWSTDGGAVTGEGLSYVDPEDGLWKQLWIDSTGTLTRAEQNPGAVSGGALRFDGESIRPDGKAVLSRLTVDPLGDQRLHVLIEHSDDDGATWQAVFDVTYVGAGTPAPATPAASGAPAASGQSMASGAPMAPPPTAPGAPAAPPAEGAEPMEAPAPAAAPAPQPPRAQVPSSGAVRASSGVVPDQEVPLNKRNKIFLESPMVLEVPIGAIQSIPEEYSWSSKETSVYVSEGVSVQRVTLSRHPHGKKVDVTAVVVLHSPDVLHHVDLTADLVWKGDVLASASLDKISIGRSILAQNRGDGLEKTLTLTVDRSRFDEAFADTEDRPILRLTVTARH